MEVSNPRRVLAVTLEGAEEQLRRVVKDLTGAAPQASTSLAGTSHDLSLKTSYYTATVPIWLDLIASPSEWASSFLSDEAKEVLGVLGGLVLVFPIPGTVSSTSLSVDDVQQLIRHVGRVVADGLGGWDWDGVLLAVGVGEGEGEEWDELCAEAGLEFVQLGGKQKERNEFGEKLGIARVKEALESNDWDQLDGPPLSDFGDFQDGSNKADDEDELDPEKLDFGYDPADFEGLRKAIWTSGQEPDTEATDAAAANAPSETKPEKSKVEQVDGDEGVKEGDWEDDDIVKMERMMRKLQAVREAGEGMSEAQRKRMAARAVEEVMKEL